MYTLIYLLIGLLVGLIATLFSDEHAWTALAGDLVMAAVGGWFGNIWPGGPHAEGLIPTALWSVESVWASLLFAVAAVVAWRAMLSVVQRRGRRDSLPNRVVGETSI